MKLNYPINAMGKTKALEESVAIAKSRYSGKTKICCTRYGNVMCSRGSVIPLWIDQIKAGNPITVTEPNMTRFIMSLEEAVDLVLYAFEHGENGDLLIMKAPACSIGLQAEAVCEMFGGKKEDIKVIGIRHGEKMYETLLTNEECAKAIDLGGFYRVPADNRGLNYDKYFKEGDVAYDGDADRCLCVDEKGNLVDGDAILYIYGKYMKERGKLENNTVVTTVMSNFGLYKAFDEAGINYAKTAVGDKYVYEYMTKNNCILGGEQSGHIIFSKYASTGDGILTSLKMMQVMLGRKKKMSELIEGLTIYPQVLENVRVTDKKAAQDDAAVQAAVQAVTEALGDTGRILVRESGTEPVLRVMVEAETKEICQKYVSRVVDVVKEKGYVVA